MVIIIERWERVWAVRKVAVNRLDRSWSNCRGPSRCGGGQAETEALAGVVVREV